MPSSSPPLVSIVIPCYNAERWVDEAIESAVGQSHEPLEVIVVDDGSTDGSREVIQSYEEDVEFVSTRNHGASAARNEGLERALGRYVKFLDADDRLYTDAVKAQVRAAEGIGEEQIVFGDGRHVDETGAVIGETEHRPRRAEENRLEYVMRMNPQTSLALHRREYLLGVGGFDEDLPKAQEYDLHIRLAVEGTRFTYRPHTIADIRQHGGEERITNQDHFGRDPYGWIERLRCREQWAAEAGLLTEAVGRILAEAAWTGGRKALRRGLPVATEYFDYSRELSASDIPARSRLYRALVRISNPWIAEKVAEFTRPLRKPFS